jgi:hypothetical protein
VLETPSKFLKMVAKRPLAQALPPMRSPRTAPTRCLVLHQHQLIECDHQNCTSFELKLMMNSKSF